MSFLRDRWYAAAWSSEIGRKPLGRKILGEDITFYRTESGQPAAVASRCPHRFAPLYFGDVVGENIKCRYHGLQFGPNGACVLNPDGSKPPPVSVKAYSVAERDSMLWIWMGDQKPQSGPPEYLSLAPTMGGLVRGLLHVNCHFLLVTDNLMDSAHATHLHAAFKTEAHVKAPKGNVRQEGDAVYYNVWAPDDLPNPFFLALYGKNIPVDQWVDVTWREPSTITVAAGVTATGRSREEGINTISVHLITPESEHSSHYFWILARDCRLENHEMSEMMRANVQRIFTEEDKWMIEGQQRMLGGAEFWSLRPALLNQDKAAGMTRRHVEKLIAEQDAKREEGSTSLNANA